MTLVLRSVRSGADTNYLFVHGLFGSSADWRDVIAHLSHERGALALDLPGHGGSEPLAPHLSSFDECVDYLAEELRSKVQKPVIGVGYSLGGRIVLGLWKRAPELFSALCLVSTFPGFQEERERELRAGTDREWIKKLQHVSADTFFSQWYDQPLFGRSEWSAELQARILQSRVELHIPNLSGIFAATSVASMPSFWHELAEAPMPVQYVAGSRDEKYLQIARQVAERNPAIAVSVIEGAGHLIPLERPAELARALDEFAGQLATSSSRA